MYPRALAQIKALYQKFPGSNEVSTPVVVGDLEVASGGTGVDTTQKIRETICPPNSAISPENQNIMCQNVSGAGVMAPFSVFRGGIVKYSTTDPGAGATSGQADGVLLVVYE